jgi:peptide/nickel transport system substrate-binding protein
MQLRDRSLVAAFALFFVAMSTVALATSPAPAVTPGPSAGPSVAGPTPYVEGVLGHAANASPFGARSAADRDLVALLFRGLVRLGPDQTIVGDLASSWDVDPSGSTWTFHLRPGLHWDDGAPLTSADVVFTIQALSDPGYDGPGAGSWGEVTATASDPTTVMLRLTTPLGGFLQAATNPIAPAHLLANVPVASLSTDPFGMHPVGSGSFRLVSLDANRAVLAPVGPVATASAGPSAAPAARGSTTPATAFPVPYLPGIEFEYFDDPHALAAAWDAGTLDAASGLAPADAAALGNEPGARLVRYPTSTLLALVPNLRPDHATYSDPTVRRSLLEAIDRSAVLAQPLLGFGSVADGLIPSWAPEFAAGSAHTVPFDPSAAIAGLTGAGWKHTATGWLPKGSTDPVQITLLSADEASNPIAFATAEAVTAAWRAIGLTVIHESVAAADLLPNRVEPGQFDIALVPLVIGLDPDLYPLLASSQTRTGGANLPGLQDQALDKLLVAARAPGSQVQRLAAYKALQDRLATTLPILPLAFRDEVVVFRDTVSGPTPRPLGEPGERFWDVLTWRLAEAPTGS